MQLQTLMRWTVCTGVLALTAPPLVAQDFTWRGRVAQEQAVEIRGVNGEIRAVRAQGNEILVTADKEWRHDDPDEVRIEVVEHSDGVTICAVYPSRRGGNTCEPGGGRNRVEDNDVSVHFTVEVPAGVTARLHTVNGDVRAGNLASNVVARTVNGGIDVATDGWAEASTVNGSIVVSMGRADWRGGMEFETVNGSITVELPDGVNTELSVSTVNGDIETDFPVTVQGRWGPRRVNGVLGDGGRELRLKTVNGGVRLRRR